VWGLASFAFGAIDDDEFQNDQLFVNSNSKLSYGSRLLQ